MFYLKLFKKTLSKEKKSQKNIEILEESKANINFKNPGKLNQLKKSNTLNKNERNKSLKKNIDLNNRSLNTKKIIKDNTENRKLYKEEKKDYHLTTFLHTRNTEDDNNREIEKNKKNYKIKNTKN